MDVPLTAYGTFLRIYLRGQWPKVALLALLMAGAVGLQLAHPLIVRSFIDAATTGTDPAVLARTALLFLGVAVLAQALAVAKTYVAEYVGWTATNGLRADLTAHCLGLDMGFHNAHLPGELVERVDEDTAALADFFARFVLEIVTSALLLAGTLAVLAAIDWRTGVGFALFAAAALLVLFLLRAVPVPASRRAMQSFADLYGYLGEWLASCEDVRARGAVPYALRGLQLKLRERLRAARDVTVLNVLSLWAPVGLVITAGTALAYVVGDRLFREGLVTVGMVYAITAYAAMVSQPLVHLSGQMQVFQRATAALGRTRELLAKESAIRPGPRDRLPAGPLGVVFDGVGFAYPNGSPVLRGVSFDLAPGRVLGLLGRTGSGKSTLARLVLRFYDPTEGAVRVGGVDLRDATEEAARERVALVTQDVQLLHASVRDNLTFFDREIADAAILGVLDGLGLGPWLAALPRGLDTEIAGSGDALSAGEAQLLAFARAFLREPDVVILDEASSRLDPATERVVERAVTRLLQNRTAIVIAHRLATVERADEILVLEGGAVREHGRRLDLLADPGSRFAGLMRVGLDVAFA